MVDHQAELITRFGSPRRVAADEAAALARLAASPAVPRDASTVILLRDAPAGGGIEAYMLRRTTTMSFAGGMYAFPGGRLDPADSDDTLPWLGPPVAEVMPGLDPDPAKARALVCAAVRETFEECGVLLATAASGREETTDLRDVPGLAADRQAMEDRRLGLADVLGRRSLALRADLLAAWTRWVAPELEPRRYDTRFFVAALPAGQQPGIASTEADGVLWIRPADALDRFTAGAMAMLPPTAFTLAELAEFEDVAGVLAAARGRDLAPVMPEIDVSAGRWRLLFPHLRPRAADIDGSTA
ncbi:NUDIX family protein [Frankia sp. EI5c]|uniref:NUDIX hydrolase n=1 Tax=Frankia sp. EI5c TaxID=683316 RepID=UPI0007C2668C|nr:NUDIX hydrolase [Frankia sp. EI5c]OAA27042.1 NUDIX family protein [Frankia sp. EI5c]